MLVIVLLLLFMLNARQSSDDHVFPFVFFLWLSRFGCWNGGKNNIKIVWIIFFTPSPPSKGCDKRVLSRRWSFGDIIYTYIFFFVYCESSSGDQTLTVMNKWWLAIAALLLLIACTADAKKKWKADEDFEFEEVHLSLLSVTTSGVWCLILFN